jgi:hypothetical protein
MTMELNSSSPAAIASDDALLDEIGNGAVVDHTQPAVNRHLAAERDRVRAAEMSEPDPYDFFTAQPVPVAQPERVGAEAIGLAAFSVGLSSFLTGLALLYFTSSLWVFLLLAGGPVAALVAVHLIRKAK